MAQEAEIIKLLRQYFQAFPKAEMPDAAWAMYARALSPLTLDEINAAMLKLLRTSKFWPSIAEIFEAARSVREQAEGTALPTAAEAWGEVMKLAHECHVTQAWHYSCPEVKRAAECYGQYELCTLLESEVGIARSQFMRMYNEICQRREKGRENEAVLSMLSKARNALQGRAEAKVLEIAEARRATV